jgi:hypothetical protein
MNGGNARRKPPEFHSLTAARANNSFTGLAGHTKLPIR